MNKDDLIVKKNNFIHAKYNLTLEEQRVILILASSIKKNDEDFKTYELKIKDYLEFMNINDHTRYEELPKICKRLLNKSLEIKKDGVITAISFLSFMQYHSKAGTICLRFDKALKPFLLNLKEAFTSYELSNVTPLKSKYSIRIYEILKSYQYIGQVTISLTDLRSMLGINEEEYKKISHFKDRILLSAEKEINEKTDIKFKFEEIKKSRKIDSIKFSIKSKINKKVKKDEIDLTGFKEKDENKINKVIEIMDNLVGKKDAESIYIKSNENLDKIIKAYKNCKNKDIDNLVGYMISLVSLEEIPEPIKNKKTKEANFEQRNYTKDDFKKLERRLLGWDVEDEEII